MSNSTTNSPHKHNKLIFIMLDGLRYDTAVTQMGYMHHLVEYGKAARYKVRSELPSLSRPLYEVLMTGNPVWRHGIATNQTVRLSHERSLFVPLNAGTRTYKCDCLLLLGKRAV